MPVPAPTPSPHPIHSRQAAKCEFLLVGTRNRIQKINKDLTVSVNGELLKRVNSTKYLGIVIDEFLDWGAHIRHMKSKIAKCVYLLKRIRTYISHKLCIGIV